MQQLTREQVEQMYVNHIMATGNPEYFIWLAIRRWDDEDLLIKLDEFDSSDIEIV